MRFSFSNPSEARDALVARMLQTPVTLGIGVPYVAGRDGARQTAAPRCDACGNVGAHKRVDGTQIVCVDADACCARYRGGLGAEVYARELRAQARAWQDQRAADAFLLFAELDVLA